MELLRALLAPMCLAAVLVAEPPVEPSPKLTPAQVVAAQLAALQHNDEPEPDHGIRVAFRFASPANRGATGPLDRFIRMVKNPAYAPMLNHRSATFGEMMIVKTSARQKVTLTDAEGHLVTYVFILSKQADEPCAGCWMTDAVIRSTNHLEKVRIAEARGPRHA